MNFKHLYKLPDKDSVYSVVRMNLPEWQRKLPIAALATALVIRDLSNLVWSAGKEFGNLVRQDYIPACRDTLSTIRQIGANELNQSDSPIQGVKEEYADDDWVEEDNDDKIV